MRETYSANQPLLQSVSESSKTSKPTDMNKPDPEVFIIDNSVPERKVLHCLKQWILASKAADIATGFFEIGGLLALDGAWQTVPAIRILMGDEISRHTKQAFETGLAAFSQRLERSIDSEKAKDDFLVGLPAVVNALKTGQIQCRMYRKAKFHAKAYIPHANDEGSAPSALVGSSNLTRPGIGDNVELNVRIDGDPVAELQAWYNRHWNEAEDITPKILRILEHHTKERYPFEIWAKALFEYVRGRESSPDQWDRKTSRIFPLLARCQREAYKKLLPTAANYTGAFLCDGVGLGKTYIGLMLIERMIARHGKRVVLFAPKTAKEDVWKPLLKKLLPDLASDFQPLVCYSHTDLQRKERTWADRIQRTIKDADVLLIDEAHHFRNPGVTGAGSKKPSRYRKLQQYLHQKGSRPKQVFFLTATPVNNSVHDFRHMLELITNGDPAYFAKGSRNLGVPNLKKHFDQIEDEFHPSPAGQIALLPTDKSSEIFNELVVQRSRRYVRASERLEAQSSAGQVLFPKREKPQVARYHLKISYGKLLRAVADAFDRDKPLFALAIYNPLSYLADSPAATPPADARQRQDAASQKQLVGLIRTMFLKRFESSAEAFEHSCVRLLRKLLAWTEVHAQSAHNKNRLHCWKIQHQKLLEQLGHEDDKQHDFLADDEDEANFITEDDRQAVALLDPQRYRLGEMLDDTFDDLEQIANFLNLVKAVHPKRDSKLTELAKLLQKNKDLAGRKVIIFTEFSDTAAYLETQLRNKNLPLTIERVDGSSSAKQRSEVIHRFAPFYNRVQPPQSPPKPIDILIATDVLAEGLNLQDADRLINFDLHWNPVRLMQRIGRVDRRLDPRIEEQLRQAQSHLKRARGKVIFWNFLPPDELDTLLRLYNRVNNKALVISRTFGIKGRKLLCPDDNFDPIREINERFESKPSAPEKLALEYENLIRQHPQLARQLPNYPLKTFSGKASPKPNAQAVFFCFRIPRPASPQSAESTWTEEAGETIWLLLDLDGNHIETQPERIADEFARTQPNTPRRCRLTRAKLAKLRKIAERHLAKRLRSLQAPAGIQPILKCWMEIS